MDYQSGGQEQQNRVSRRSIALEWFESYGSCIGTAKLIRITLDAMVSQILFFFFLSEGLFIQSSSVYSVLVEASSLVKSSTTSFGRNRPAHFTPDASGANWNLFRTSPPPVRLSIASSFISRP